MTAIRTIRVVNSQTSQVKRFETDAEVWGEFLDAHEGQLDLTNLKASVKETKVTLEHRGAILPEGDITIFLRLSKQEAGADTVMSFKEMREYVKKNAESIAPIKKELEKNLGKNWTQFKTHELIHMIDIHMKAVIDADYNKEVPAENVVKEQVEQVVAEHPLVPEQCIEEVPTTHEQVDKDCVDYQEKSRDIAEQNGQSPVDRAFLNIENNIEYLEEIIQETSMNGHVHAEIQQYAFDVHDSIASLRTAMKLLSEDNYSSKIEKAKIEDKNLKKELEDFERGLL